MSVFHVSSNGPGKCEATKGKCPFGGKTGLENHFTSKEAAAHAYDTSMEAEAHKKLAKKMTYEKALAKIYTPDTHHPQFSLFKHEYLMAVDRSQFKKYIDDVEAFESETIEAVKKNLEHDEASTEYYAKKALRDSLGKRPKDPDFAATLEARVEELKEKLDAQRREITMRQYSPQAKKYHLAKTAYDVTAPKRIVAGIELGPGEGVSRALYTTNGELVGLLKYNQRGPHRGLSAVKADGSRVVLKSQSNKADVRYEELKKEGYVIGKVIVPVAITQDATDRCFNRGKVAISALKKFPPKPVANFDEGPEGWANVANSQAALI